MIKTKYGNASIDNEGYYRIHTKTEGNRNKLLHRLIFEEEHGKLSVNDIVHHKDGDRLNNDLSNLELISKEAHDNKHGFEKSLKTNTTGYYRVSKQFDPHFKQGFRWRYCYSENGKQKCLKSVDLGLLKDKVLAKGLPWIEFEGGE